MIPSVQPTMHRLRPFWGCVTVVDSPVDEETHRSGLIVPLSHANFNEPLRRGVVQHVSEYDHHGDTWSPGLVPGMVVYYETGHELLDVVIVPLHHVVGYLEDDE